MDEFKEFIEAAPQRITEYDFETKEWNVSYIDSITTQDALKSLRATQQNRLEEFVRYLYTLPHDNWGTVLKMVTENLIYSYGDTKMAVPKRPSKDIHNIGEVRRSLMLVLYELVGHVTTVASRLNISYPDYFIKNIEKKFGEFCLLPDLMRYKESEQPSHTQIQEKLIPEELNTPIAREYLAKAIEKGLCDSNYKWLKGLQLLSCFASEMSLKLKIGKGQNSDGTDRLSWKPFEELFGIEKYKLRNNYNDIKKTGQIPSDINLVDSIFN